MYTEALAIWNFGIFILLVTVSYALFIYFLYSAIVRKSKWGIIGAIIGMTTYTIVLGVLAWFIWKG